METYAVLLSGGIGTRTGYNMPKQFIEVKNKPFLAYCIEKFTPIEEFTKIIITSPSKYIEKTEELIEKYFPDDDRIIILKGGKTRQDTLMNSVKYIDKNKHSTDAIVINHDAARIFVSTNQIRKCIKYTKKYNSSSPVIPTTDVTIETKDNQVTKMPNRYTMKQVQTPQGFKLNEYQQLYKTLTKKEKDSVHEIIRVYYLKDKQVYLYDGEKSNFKITNPIDVEIARSILGEK